PGAVLRHAGHRQRMESLDHQGADGREGETAVAVDAPDQASRAEQAVVDGVFGHRALVCLGQRLEGAESGGIHTAKIRTSITPRCIQQHQSSTEMTLRWRQRRGILSEDSCLRERCSIAWERTSAKPPARPLRRIRAHAAAEYSRGMNTKSAPSS